MPHYPIKALLSHAPKLQRMVLFFALGTQAFAGNQTPAQSPASLPAPTPEARTGIKEFYVATQGNDNAPGTQAAPFASLQRARDAIREWRTEDNSAGKSIVVYIREGTYPQTSMLTFSAADSGSETAPVVYQAYPGERARITGGLALPLKDFAPVINPAVKGRLPQAAQNKVVAIDLKKHGYDRACPAITSNWG